MISPITFNANKILEEIRTKEDLIYDLNEKLSAAKYELEELQKINAANITIQWKESIKKCLLSDNDEKYCFLQTPAYVSNCVAWTHGVNLTRDIKNKVSTTLSIMFNQSLLGKIQHNGKTYYGNPKYFKSDLITLKEKYVEWIRELAP
jgi:hypothetical protein